MTAREMKDSGVEWIGTIPACWEVHRIKTNFDIIGGNGFSPSLQGQETGDLPVCKASDISNAGAKLSKAENFITFSEAKLYSFNLIPKGSVLFAKIGEAMKKNNRTLTLVECCADNNCQAMVPKKIDSQFSYYLFNCIDMTWFDNAGTVPCISNQKLKNSKIPYPSIFEQKRIAKYLNNKCAEIDSLASDIEKQIETLQEYKKTVITEAVTKGLDPNVEMKDSGVEWIGIMPEAWGLKPLKYCVFLKTNKSKTNEGYVGLEHVKSWSGQLIPPDSDEFISEGEALTFTKGDVLFGKLRPYLAKCFLASCDGSCSTEFLVLKPTNVDEQFLKFLLLTPTFIDTVNMSTNGVKMPRANWDFVGSIKIPIPNKKEQTAIANFLDTKCAEIDTIVKEKQKQLEVLAQYKQSLIYEYVTGKKAVPT